MLEVSALLREVLHPGAPARPARRSGGVQVVVWNVVRHCNQRCLHCYVAAGTAPSGGDLGTDDARRLLDALAGAGVRAVVFSGGEPCLRPDLCTLVTHASGLGLSPSLSSNGTLLGERVAAELAEAGCTYVGVSLDGPAAFNDAWRGMPGGHARALAGLRYARAAGMRTGLRMTLLRRNASALGELLALAESERIDRFYTSHLLGSGRAVGLRDELAPAESRALLLELFALAEASVRRGAATSVVSGGNDSAGPLFAAWARARFGDAAGDRVEASLRARGGNSAGEALLDVDADGEVHPDQFWRDISLGNVLRDGMDAVLAHPLRALLARRQDHLVGRCGSCPSLALCRGSHRERALAAGGDLWSPDPACVLTDSEVGALPGREVA